MIDKNRVKLEKTLETNNHRAGYSIELHAGIIKQQTLSQSPAPYTAIDGGT